MRHINVISAQKPASANELSTFTAIINFLSSIVGLFQQISSLLGINAYLEAKYSEDDGSA